MLARCFGLINLVIWDNSSIVLKMVILSPQQHAHGFMPVDYLKKKNTTKEDK